MVKADQGDAAFGVMGLSQAATWGRHVHVSEEQSERSRSTDHRDVLMLNQLGKQVVTRVGTRTAALSQWLVPFQPLLEHPSAGSVVIHLRGPQARCLAKSFEQGSARIPSRKAGEPGFLPGLTLALGSRRETEHVHGAFWRA